MLCFFKELDLDEKQLSFVKQSLLSIKALPGRQAKDDGGSALD